MAVAAAVGVLVIGLAWWIGPGLYEPTSSARNSQVVEAAVTLPAPCSVPGARETVRFELDGEVRDGTLSACGHRKDEQVTVAVPLPAGSGMLEVRASTSSPGYGDLRGTIGLVLVALSCVAGGSYAFLLSRASRRKPAFA